MQRYIQQQKEYKEQQSLVRQLKSWTTNTVAPYYFELACDPAENLAQWYANLKRLVGTTDIES
jgi:hypothetical protein